MILSGHTGPRANLMGAYKLQEERVNESPLYKKADEPHYIYRLKTGKWMVAASRTSVDKELGNFITQGTAHQLPTDEGVAWKFYDSDGKKWVPDGSLSVTDAAMKAAEKKVATPTDSDKTVCARMLCAGVCGARMSMCLVRDELVCIKRDFVAL